MISIPLLLSLVFILVSNQPTLKRFMIALVIYIAVSIAQFFFMKIAFNLFFYLHFAILGVFAWFLSTQHK